MPTICTVQDSENVNIHKVLLVNLDNFNYSNFSCERFWNPFVTPRETKEGWPLPTVANRDSRSSYEKGLSLIGSLGSSCQYKRFLYCL
jgi:hypothetical protein